MRYKITPLLIGDCERFTVETKEHWWNRWHFIFDGKYPRLFSSEDLKKFFPHNYYILYTKRYL